MVIELCVVQFWSEIVLVISAQIALHSVQLPLFIGWDSVDIFKVYGETVANLGFNT